MRVIMHALMMQTFLTVCILAHLLLLLYIFYGYDDLLISCVLHIFIQFPNGNHTHVAICCPVVFNSITDHRKSGVPSSDYGQFITYTNSQIQWSYMYDSLWVRSNRKKEPRPTKLCFEQQPLHTLTHSDVGFLCPTIWLSSSQAKPETDNPSWTECHNTQYEDRTSIVMPSYPAVEFLGRNCTTHSASTQMLPLSSLLLLCLFVCLR